MDEENRLFVNRRAKNGQDTSTLSLLLSSGPPQSWCKWICLLSSSTSLFFPEGPRLRFSGTQESAQGSSKVSHLYVSSLLQLTGLLKYLPAAGDQTLAPNIILNMHYTEGLMITADVVRISLNYEDVSWHFFVMLCHWTYKISCSLTLYHCSLCPICVTHPSRF